MRTPCVTTKYGNFCVASCRGFKVGIVFYALFDVSALLYLGFALMMFVFYSLVTVVMERNSATMFNLIIQTTQFYALLFGLFLFNYKVSGTP